MRRLGLPALARLLSARQTIPQEPEKGRNIDDPDFECNAEGDAHSDGDVSDDGLLPEAEALEDMDPAHATKKHKVLDLPLCHAFMLFPKSVHSALPPLSIIIN
jgi:hypothetical protein